MRSGRAVMSGCPSNQANVYEIDPTNDERWDYFVQTQPRASIFHTRAWLESLRDTYGYTPRAVTTSAPGAELTDGLPFCEISGLFGKRRLVSLPFSDHCQPLIQSEKQFVFLREYLERKREEEKWDYVELRPVVSGLAAGSGFEKSQSFVLHRLDLQGNPEIYSRASIKAAYKERFGELKKNLWLVKTETQSRYSGTSISSWSSRGGGTGFQHNLSRGSKTWFATLGRS
jgi:hypothetical protein